MRRLLLISSSKTHGTGFLEHCREAIREHLQGIDQILFVPYALSDRDQYASLAAKSFEAIDVKLQSIHVAPDPVDAVMNAKSIFVGGGNSFRLLRTLYDLELLKPIRDAVTRGVPYMGSSAGTNMACPTIRTTNDMPIVEPPSLQALDLIPFQINPHFVDADPGSQHQGETREQRLTEYLEENSVPVLGIREGTWLVVHDDECRLCGINGAILFRCDQPPEEMDQNADLSFLLSVPTAIQARRASE